MHNSKLLEIIRHASELEEIFIKRNGTTRWLAAGSNLPSTAASEPIPCKRLRLVSLYETGTNVQEALFERLDIPRHCIIKIAAPKWSPTLESVIHPSFLKRRQPRFTRLDLFEDGLVAIEERDQVHTTAVELYVSDPSKLALLHDFVALGLEHVRLVNLAFQWDCIFDETGILLPLLQAFVGWLPSVETVSFGASSSAASLSAIVPITSLPNLVHLRLLSIALDAPAAETEWESHTDFLLKWLKERRGAERLAPIWRVLLADCVYAEETLERLKNEGQVEVELIAIMPNDTPQDTI